MSVAVAPSWRSFHAPVASAALAASNGYSCSTDVGVYAARCGAAAAHLVARCCISPVVAAPVEIESNG
jgi:hypothetical protein